MRTTAILFLLIGLFNCSSVSAQLVFTPPQSDSDPYFKTHVGQSISELCDAIKVDLLDNSIKNGRKQFLKQCENISTPAEAGAALSVLAKSIKSSKFRKPSYLTGFEKQRSKLNSMKQAKDLLKNLENNITPDAFAPIWKLQRSSWLNNLTSN